MEKKRKTFAGRITRKVLIWLFFIALGLSFLLFHFEGNATREFYSEIYHNKMLITKEYTRRVISDVYVAVTNNIYYLEHTLDDPDSHKETMARIVKSGTRVRSCGISFIQDYYYPQKGQHHFCPFAWKNAVDPDVIYTEDMGDADLDYLQADWFLDIVKSDSAQWTDPFYDGYNQQTTLTAYMAPIHDREGRTVAVLGADVSLDWLTGKLSEIDSTINNNSTIIANSFKLKSNSFIVNYDGTFLTHHDESRIMKDNFFSLLESHNGSNVEELVAKMKSGIEPEERSNEKFIVDGKECYLFYTPIKYTRWLLVTAVPCGAIETLSYLNGATVVFIVIMSMLIIIALGYYYIRKGIKPLRQLTHSTNSIAKGHFDTRIPEISQNDEIGQLRNSIEEMQFELYNYIDESKRKAALETETE